MRIANGAFSLADEGTRFTAIDADIGLQADRVDVRRLTMADKDGHTLQVTGGAGVSLAERQVGQVDLRVTSDDFRVLDGNFGRLHLDTDLKVTGGLRALRTEGTMTVRSGRIEVDHVLEELRPAKGPVIDVAPSPASDQPDTGRGDDRGPAARAGGGHGEPARDACGAAGRDRRPARRSSTRWPSTCASPCRTRWSCAATA